MGDGTAQFWSEEVHEGLPAHRGPGLSDREIDEYCVQVPELDLSGEDSMQVWLSRNDLVEKN